MAASKLIKPSIDYKESYLEALAEYHAEDKYMFQNPNKLSQNFKKFITELCAEKGYPHQPFQDWVEPVPETIVWMVKDGMYLGTVDIRHRLNWHLEKWGGNVHFIIRPSMRGKGYGKKILQKAIPIINYVGVDKALLTVCPHNIAGIRIIEFCGGELEDELPKTDKFPARKRYWLDCT